MKLKKAITEQQPDSALLADLVAMPAAEPDAEPAPPPKPKAASTPRRRAQPSPLVDKIRDQGVFTVALLAVLAFSAVLWRTDGFFTLLSLEGMGVKMAGMGGWRWLIPAAITAATIAFWPKARISAEEWERLTLKQQQRKIRSRRFTVGIFLSVIGFNVGTSFDGMMRWAAARHLPLFAGFTIPQTGWGLWIVAGLAALFLAFGPEKLWRWSFGELVAIWWSEE